RVVAIIVLPLGLGVYIFSDLVTKILLGNQWSEASGVIGLWALTSSITIVFSYFNSEVYRAKGRPKLSFISQMLHLIFLVPVVAISGSYGFWPLVIARSWSRMQGIVVGFIIMKFVIGFPILKTIKNVMPIMISTSLMGIIGYALLQLYEGILWNLFAILVCVLFYFGIVMAFPNLRKEIFSISKKIIPKSIMEKLNQNS